MICFLVNPSPFLKIMLSPTEIEQMRAAVQRAVASNVVTQENKQPRRGRPLQPAKPFGNCKAETNPSYKTLDELFKAYPPR